MKLLKKMMMPFRSRIKTDAEYQDRLAVLSALMDKGDGVTDAEADYMELLGTLLEDYEREHNPEIEAAVEHKVTPQEAIRWAMDRHGLKQKDLCVYIGSEPLVSAVLRGKKNLSKQMMVRLHEGLGIPYDDLMPSLGTSGSYRKVAVF